MNAEMGKVTKECRAQEQLIQRRYLAVPGSKRSTSLSPMEYALNVFPLMWGPGAVFTEPGSWATNSNPLGRINSSPSLTESSVRKAGPNSLNKRQKNFSKRKSRKKKFVANL